MVPAAADLSKKPRRSNNPAGFSHISEDLCIMGAMEFDSKKPISVDGESGPARTPSAANVALVATPDAELQRALTETCIDIGFRVARAGTAPQAIELCEAFCPILCIIAAVLPDPGGAAPLTKLLQLIGDEGHTVYLLGGPCTAEYLREQLGSRMDRVHLIDGQMERDVWLSELRDTLSPLRVELTRVEASLIRRQDTVPPNRGLLETYSFVDLYLHAMSSRHNGYLGLSDGEHKRVIFWQNGTPVYARSTDPNESFGRHLVGKGLLDDASELRSRELMARTGRMQSEALVELRLIDPAVVFEELQSHVRSLIVDCFGWIYGQFLISDDRTVLTRIVPLSLDATKILFEGIETFNDADEIERSIEIGPNDTVEFLASPILDNWQSQLTTKEMLAVKAARRGISLQAIVNEARIDYEGLLRFFFSLFKIGALGFRTGLPSEEALTRRMYVGPDPTTYSPEEMARIDDFIRTYSDARRKNYFEVYEAPLRMEIDLDAVRRRYVELSKRFHPDRFRKYAHWNLERQVEELGQRINLGYETLRDDEKRRAYLDLLTGESEASRRRQAKEAKNREAAHAASKAGISQLFSGEALLATESFRLALELVPGDSRYSTWYQFSRFWENPSGRRREAYEQLQKLAEGGSECRGDSLYQLGIIDLHAGALKLAERRFDGALKADPHHKLAREAASELAKALKEPSPERSLILVERLLSRFRKTKKGAPPLPDPAPVAATAPLMTIDDDDVDLEAYDGKSGTSYPSAPGPRLSVIVPTANGSSAPSGMTGSGSWDRSPAETHAGKAGKPVPARAKEPAGQSSAKATTPADKSKEQPKQTGKPGELYDIEDIFDEIDI